MSISNQRTDGNPADADTTAFDYSAELRRDIAIAMIIAALLLAGVAVGGSVASQQEPLLAQQEPPSAQPLEASGAGLSLKFEYFPSSYVNQGVESTEELPTF